MDHSKPNTTADVLEHNERLVKYTIAQAQADGRPLHQLFGNTAFVADVVARFTLYDADEERRAINEEVADELAAHREQTGGGIDAATWGR